MFELHMSDKTAEGKQEEVAIIFTVRQLGKLKDVINSQYVDSKRQRQDGEETRYLKLSGVIIRNP